MTSHVPRIRARLTLPTQRRVLGLLDGEYVSVVAGRGTEFNDLREYVRGDDVKDLDWKASARVGQPLVRRYVAVRRRRVQLVVSTGRTMAAAHTLTTSKRDLAVEVAGLLGWLAVRQGDLVGAVTGHADDRVVVPAGSGELHLERCLATVHDHVTPHGGAADLDGLLRHAVRTLRQRSLVLLVCEDEELTDDARTSLRRLAVQHQVLVVSVGDLDPVTVPVAAGSYDVATGRGWPAWLRDDPELAAQVDDSHADRREAFRVAMARAGVSHQHAADSPSGLVVLRQLLERQRRARRQ